jgi:hypothetical protein
MTWLSGLSGGAASVSERTVARGMEAVAEGALPGAYRRTEGIVWRNCSKHRMLGSYEVES